MASGGRFGAELQILDPAVVGFQVRSREHLIWQRHGWQLALLDRRQRRRLTRCDNWSALD
jgi:hypothetical protein